MIKTHETTEFPKQIPELNIHYWIHDNKSEFKLVQLESQGYHPYALYKDEYLDVLN